MHFYSCKDIAVFISQVFFTLIRPALPVSHVHAIIIVLFFYFCGFIMQGDLH